MRPGMFYPWALFFGRRSDDAGQGGDVSIAAALSNLIAACWVLGAIFVVVLVVVTCGNVRGGSRIGRRRSTAPCDKCVPLGDPRSSVALRLPGFNRLAGADRCLAALILELNQTGFRTEASCCGHGERPACVLFSGEHVRLKVAGPERPGSARDWIEVQLPSGDFMIEIPATALRSLTGRRG